VPDPASRFQPEDVFGPSQVVDTAAFHWYNDDWKGRPWLETVLYELHVGTFTPNGTYDALRTRLNYLRELGVTAIELMPLADFSGRRNWGYDGVLPFAPDASYGSPRELKWLIDEAHGLGMMVFLDVVYNHFGPEGNFLHLYAPYFFTEAHQTPWGAAIDFSVPQVREFFIANALYWLRAYRFDGLRLDAVHAVWDDSSPHILEELARKVRSALPPDRHVHLVLENDANQARFLERDHDTGPRFYVAQWNDDIHHVCHVLATGEDQGYYQDYVDIPLERLGRCLAEGFAYQGEPSAHRGGAARGEPSAHLPPEAFVAFLQNHDQVGNRAFGERLSVLTTPQKRRALPALLLLSPQIPLIFMGEEWGARRPFPFFCDFSTQLADAVREGRRREFAAFPEFADPAKREHIPDPNAPETAASAILKWDEPIKPEYYEWLKLYRELLAIRRERILPLLPLIQPGKAFWKIMHQTTLVVGWPLEGDQVLVLVTNLGPKEQRIHPGTLAATPGMETVYAAPNALLQSAEKLILGPWAVFWGLAGGSNRMDRKKSFAGIFGTRANS
jgi:maltooligosyltrehalose trehalohydrolase